MKSEQDSGRATWSRKGWLVGLTLIGAAGIVIWQSHTWSHHEELSKEHRIGLSTGIRVKPVREFYFFYHTLGLFPLRTQARLEQSTAFALDTLNYRPETLRTEYGRVIRFGDWGRIWTFALDAWWSGNWVTPSLTPFFATLWILSLVVLFVGLMSAGQPGLAVVLTLILGSHPTQLYEAFHRENLFSMAGSVALLMLGLHARLLFGKKTSRWTQFGLPLFCGVLLATIREIRSEPALIAISVLGLYLLAPNVPKRRRFSMALIFVLALGGAARGWAEYWSRTITHTTQLVKDVGGTPFPLNRLQTHHELWHPLWCGLGDFGRDKGFRWQDLAANWAAAGPLRDHYGLDFQTLRSGYYPPGDYHKNVADNPEYHQVIRQLFLDTVTQEPLWYVRILGKRFWRILVEASPVQLQWGGQPWASLPFNGVIGLWVLAIAIWFRRWKWVGLLLFCSPLALTPLLIYSGRGSIHYSQFHYFAAGMAGVWLAQVGLRWWGRRRQISAGSSSLLATPSSSPSR